MKDSLKILRIKADLSQSKLAELAGVTQASITRYEANNNHLRRASYETLEALADALGVEVADINLQKREVLIK